MTLAPQRKDPAVPNGMLRGEAGALTSHERIVKDRARLKVAPNLADYDETCRRFTWAAARSLIDGLPHGGLNIAHEAVDRHAAGAHAGKVALRWLGRRGERREITYGALAEETSRFANAIRSLGVGEGERVFVLAGRIPELFTAVLGSLKAGCVICPLFSAFGPEPIEVRLSLGDARVLVTTASLYRRKVAALRRKLPGLSHVIVVEDEAPVDEPGVHAWSQIVPAASPYFTVAATRPESPALLHFTSGTTGRPKGALHVHEAVVMHAASGHYALDLHEDDIFWCTADAGWVTGTSYGIIAPLVGCVTAVVVEAEFDAETWYAVLEREQVSVWYTAPTAIRMMMRLGAAALAERDLSSLRFMASVGEPLNPEAVLWSNTAFGMPFHDNWWQTETGGIMIANFAAMDVKPGSMGRPVPGVTAAIVTRCEDGAITVCDAPMVAGELALRPGWPSMMRGYLNEDTRYAKCFAHGWYLTGDLAMRDAEGYYWFVGRADDMIKSSGHLIGPFEVESALLEHPAVAEAGVIGKPDPTAGEVVKAFVSLKPGHAWSETLRRDILGHARTRLGAAVAPKEIDALPTLPRTRSGKIMRRLLKARELGLPEGDLSTLEGNER